LSVAASTIQQFYARNDSPLFGDFQVSRGKAETPPRALEGEDIRSVLKALSPSTRTPLLLVWQSGIEISRILSLSWGQLQGIQTGEHPFKIELFGRKKHNKSYYTFIGRDGVSHLLIQRGNWIEEQGREPGDNDLVFLGKEGTGTNAAWLNYCFRSTAMKLSKQGIVKSKDPRSWHSHALRHSFRTEASHAKVGSEISEFFQGHIGGIKFVYVHSGELHPEVLAKEYIRLEPFVSLDHTETTLRGEYEDREKILLRRVLALEERISRLIPEGVSSVR
jgi:integrase